MTEHDLEKGDLEKLPERSRESSVTASPDSAEASNQEELPVKSTHVQKTDAVADPSGEKAEPSVQKIPRSKRRGLLAQLALLPEVDDPKNYSRGKKWTITFIISIAAAAAPTGSGILLPALSDITKDLHTTPTIANLSVAMYMLALAICPLWWSSFSETLGRRSIYLVSFATYVLWCVLSAISNSIGMFIVFRMLNGGASASVQAVGAGTIADIWEVRERGRAMGIFYLGPLCGPLLSPIIGGALNEGWGWRSTQWFCVIYGGVVWLGLLFGLPETLKARKSVVRDAEAEVMRQTGAGRIPLERRTTTQSVQIKTKKWIALLRRFFVDPLRIILTLRFGAVAITVWYASTTFWCLYFLNISVQQVFGAPPYGYSSIIVGCMYIPSSLGYLVASIFGGRWVDYIMRRKAEKADRRDENGKLIFRPEDRVGSNAWTAAALFPISLLWYGWAAGEGVIWIVPLIGNFFFGFSSMLVFGMATTMLTEFMPQKASHGIAANNFVRNIFATVAGIVAEPMIRAIGNGWCFTIWAIIVAISGPTVIILMKRYGDHWRVKLDRELNKEN